LNFALWKFIDLLCMTPKLPGIEGKPPNPIIIIILKCMECCQINVSDISPLKNWPIPGTIALGASVNQPSVQKFTVRIEPDFIATFEGSTAATTGTSKSWLWRK